MVVINGHNIETNSKLSGADLEGALPYNEDTTGRSYSDKNNMRGIEADSPGVKISSGKYTLLWSSHSTNFLIGGNPITVLDSGNTINLSNESHFSYKWNDTDGLYEEYFEENFKKTSTDNTIKVTKIVEDINDYDIVYKQPFADDDMVGTLTLDDGEKIDVGDYSIEWTDPSSSTTWKDFQPLIVTASGDTTMTKITFTGQDWVYYWDPSRNLYIEDFQDDSGEDPTGDGPGEEAPAEEAPAEEAPAEEAPVEEAPAEEAPAEEAPAEEESVKTDSSDDESK